MGMDNQELYHYKNGSQRKDHKYVSREYKNGRWVYYYDNSPSIAGTAVKNLPTESQKSNAVGRAHPIKTAAPGLKAKRRLAEYAKDTAVTQKQKDYADKLLNDVENKAAKTYEKESKKSNVYSERQRRFESKSLRYQAKALKSEAKQLRDGIDRSDDISKYSYKSTKAHAKAAKAKQRVAESEAIKETMASEAAAVDEIKKRKAKNYLKNRTKIDTSMDYKYMF